MNIDFPMEEAVRKRVSVRNYADRGIEAGKAEAIGRFIAALRNPFGGKVRFHELSGGGLAGQKQPGTYGVIKGAKRYIGASVKREPMALEALGYEMETLILYLASLGIGTCWLGGTFSRKGFAKAMEIGEDELFPAVTPYGCAAPKTHAAEALMRKAIRADRRKPWEELFFLNDFSTPLTEQAAGDLAFPLEMLRLGPSASNKQPWRVLLKGDACHFYERREPGYSAAFPYDIQRLDMGIAAAHFGLSAQEKGVRGRFVSSGGPAIALPERLEYVFSWQRE